MDSLYFIRIFKKAIIISRQIYFEKSQRLSNLLNKDLRGCYGVPKLFIYVMLTRVELRDRLNYNDLITS